MDFRTNTVGFTADQKLIDFIRAKVDKLELMNDSIEKTEVFLRVEKNDQNENKLVPTRVFFTQNPPETKGKQSKKSNFALKRDWGSAPDPVLDRIFTKSLAAGKLIQFSSTGSPG